MPDVSPPPPGVSPPRAAYIHVPFCRHHCGYCNFTIVADRDDLIASYLDAIEREMSWLGQPVEVETLFIGGGTPTHLSLDQLRRLLSAVRRWFPPVGAWEWSVEANPCDITVAKADLLAEFGVNRISLGVQSFNAQKLDLLERDHRADVIQRAVEICRSRFDSIALDLIFGVPGESRPSWQSDLNAALALKPNHISTYGLTYERGTSFWGRRLRGELTSLEEETERALYVAAIDTLTASGFEHYEVSNFALPGWRCRHNEVYWSGGRYHAVGPGAARFVGDTRSTNHRSTFTYLRRVMSGQSPVAEVEALSREEQAREKLVLALRTMKGVALADFEQQTGFSAHALADAAIRRYTEWGLLESCDGRLRLTRPGLMVSDSLWPDFLASDSTDPRKLGS